jgi:YafQ family addiction module toxin component
LDPLPNSEEKWGCKKMYALSMAEDFEKKLKKLTRRDSHRAEILMKKVDEILEEPERYKNLRGPLSDLHRVHINSHFVLTYSVDIATKTVCLVDFGHHDEIYKRK